MITLLQPLPIGNAIRVFLNPPSSAVYWRVLKKATDTFSGVGDLDAVVVFDGDDKTVLDSSGVINNVAVFYKVYYFANNAWVAGNSVMSTAAAVYNDEAADVLSLVRERLELGLKVEVDRGELNNDLGYIQVYTAPPALTQNLRFPLVSIHLEDESPAERFIGDGYADEWDIVDEEWHESEGWLAAVKLSIVGWSLNPDQRIDLRKAIRRILIGNLPVFDDKGFIKIEFSSQDVDALGGEYNADIYQCMFNFSCIAPVRVGRSYSGDELVSDVVVNGIAAS